MEALLHDILRMLVAIGPWIIFVIALAETAAFVGLLVPAEATVLLGGFLAQRGVFQVEEILAAAFFGGLVGDQVGYLLGRHGGTRIAARGGPIGRLWRRYELAAAHLFRTHAAVAVTLARFLSFARTLMPWFAGMSGLGYARFTAYDLVGVLGWAVGSVALGYLAGESWRIAASAVGTVSGAILALIALGAVVVALHRRRAAGAAPSSADEPDRVPGDDPAPVEDSSWSVSG